MAIEFNPGDHGAQGSYNDPVPPSSKMVGWVMKTGLVRDEKQANYVLLVLALLFFLATVWMVFGNSNTPQEGQLTPEREQSIRAHRSNTKN